MNQVALKTDEMLALRFVGDRVENFIPLVLQVKRLVLQIVEYYLDTFYPFQDESQAILSGIQSDPNEEKMVSLYKQFLEFLPTRFRAAVQGRYLYQEPTQAEKQLNEKEPAMKDLTEADVQQLVKNFDITDTVLNELSQLRAGELSTTPALQAWVETALGTPVNEQEVQAFIATIKDQEFNI